MKKFITAIVIACAAMLFAPTANADSDTEMQVAICKVFDRTGVTVKAIRDIGEILMDSGYSSKRSAELVYDSTVYQCPWHTATLNRVVKRELVRARYL